MVIEIIQRLMRNLFNQREISHPEFRVRLTRAAYHGSEKIPYPGPMIWDILPASFKEVVS